MATEEYFGYFQIRISTSVFAVYWSHKISQKIRETESGDFLIIYEINQNQNNEYLTFGVADLFETTVCQCRCPRKMKTTSIQFDWCCH